MTKVPQTLQELATELVGRTISSAARAHNGVNLDDLILTLDNGVIVKLKFSHGRGFKIEICSPSLPEPPDVNAFYIDGYLTTKAILEGEDIHAQTTVPYPEETPTQPNLRPDPDSDPSPPAGVDYPQHIIFHGNGKYNLPPIPPRGWPVPRAGDIIAGEPPHPPYKVITVKWDYHKAKVDVNLKPLPTRSAGL